MMPDASARSVWTAVESQFLDNRETRALLLDAQFHGFKQGDLPIADYCRRLKTMADQLGNLGELVSNRTLVLNVIRGLNAKYTAIGRHIHRGHPFPTFLEAKNDLLLEITLGASNPDPPTALLAAGAGGSSTPAPQQRPSGSGGGSGGGSSRTRRSGRRNNRQPKSGCSSGGASGNGGTGVGPQAASSVVPWPTLHNPWVGAIQLWSSPRPQQAAPTAPQAFLAHQAQLQQLQAW